MSRKVPSDFALTDMRNNKSESATSKRDVLLATERLAA